MTSYQSREYYKSYPNRESHSGSTKLGGQQNKPISFFFFVYTWITPAINLLHNLSITTATMTLYPNRQLLKWKRSTLIGSDWADGKTNLPSVLFVLTSLRHTLKWLVAP